MSNDFLSKKSNRESIKQQYINESKNLQDFITTGLLDRLFFDEKSKFILIGGQSLLFQYADSRQTKDVDFKFQQTNLDDFLVEFRSLINLNLNDNLYFQIQNEEMSKNENILKITLNVRHNNTPHNNLKIDINFIDKEIETKRFTEIFRGKNIFDEELTKNISYRMYSNENQLADKLCAIQQTYLNNYRSSRIKDLYDINLILENESIDIPKLKKIYRTEKLLRHIPADNVFSIPKDWNRLKFNKQLKLKINDSEYEKIVSRVFEFEDSLKEY